MKKISTKCALRNAIEHGGIAPSEIMGQALREEPESLREHIERMFLRGLTTEQLLNAEVEAIAENVKRYRRDAIAGWYLSIFDILVENAKNANGLYEILVDFVCELYKGGDAAEERDGSILLMMAECVRRELISVDRAADYIADEVQERHYTESDLRDREYVRDSLVSAVSNLNAINPLL